MSRVAFVFPGQGARDLLQAIEFASTTPTGQALLERACRATGHTLDDVRARGGRLLESTRVLQPLLTATSLATFTRLDLRATSVLGHSLGEVAALAAAGLLSMHDAIDFAAARGAAMEAAAALAPGGLVALESMQTAQRALDAIAELELGLINAPDEVVLSGSNTAVREVVARFRGKQLPVAGAWHSRAMAPAVEALRSRHAALAERLTQPVDFVSTLAAVRADAWVVVGPGHVLRGLLRRNLGAAATILTTENEADLHRTSRHLLEAA